MPKAPAGYAAGFLPSKPFGFFLEFAEGAKRAQITLARITSAPSALASSRACAWATGPGVEHQGLVLDQRLLIRGGEGGGGGRDGGTGHRRHQKPPGAASGRLSHQGHSNATTGRELRSGRL